jgi:hypothetical protein
VVGVVVSMVEANMKRVAFNACVVAFGFLAWLENIVWGS